LGLYFSKALFEGLIFGGAYTWRGLFSEIYGNFYIFFAFLEPLLQLRSNEKEAQRRIPTNIFITK